jgi:hypothetical protein
MAFWGYIGFRIATFFAHQDNIWQTSGAVIGAAVSFLEKKIFRETDPNPKSVL